MPSRQQKGPRYDLCNQTITLYHRQGKDDIRRVVIHSGGYLDLRKNRNMDKLGSREVNSFLAVLPQDADGKEYLPPGDYAALPPDDAHYTLVAGDKLLLGVGPEIATDAQWSSFVPGKVAGLVIVQQIDPKHWHGALCHLEVGGQ